MTVCFQTVIISCIFFLNPLLYYLQLFIYGLHKYYYDCDQKTVEKYKSIPTFHGHSMMEIKSYQMV